MLILGCGANNGRAMAFPANIVCLTHIISNQSITMAGHNLVGKLAARQIAKQAAIGTAVVSS